MCEVLLKAGANLDGKNKAGKSPMRTVSYNVVPNLIEFFLSKGSKDLNGGLYGKKATI